MISPKHEDSLRIDDMTLYSKEMSEKICLLLAEGYSVNEIERMEKMPCAQTIFRWAWQHPEFYEVFDKAREFGTHAMNYKLLQQIEDSEPVTPGEIAKLKILVDQYRWFIGKINQRKYGERTTIAGDKDSPIQLNLASALDNRIAAARAAPVIEHESVALPVIDVIAEQSIDND